MYQYPNYLAHYGVLGMKLGQHRARKAYAKADAYAERAKSSKEGLKEGLAIAKYSKAHGRSTKFVDWQNKKEREAYRKLSARSKQYRKDAQRITKRNAELAGGKKVYDRVTTQSTAKLVGKSMVMGSYGALKYEQARSRDKSVGKSLVPGVSHAYADTFTFGLTGVIEPRVSAKKSNKNRKK